ncbi:TonB-dependent siderophore receptor [Hymenobacter sp. ASUV-10]|uniref:TonB-dependent siderophore receptor n=1 Tax=Hymenobacter aranciens TaxID=3063996 RepID=A0ABT9B844_9BACT|nr:TonB-dependent siderophore receptor [Hymenobacter sp. ASUV-10]MDO7874441.1 TonB-dependent siderophore receptor [Hymenobacter sp. ASUV-10]
MKLLVFSLRPGLIAAGLAAGVRPRRFRVFSGLLLIISWSLFAPGQAQAQPSRSAADTIRKISSKELEEVTVQGRYYKQYTTNSVSSVLRLQTPLLNLSQNIQVVTPEIIADQASFNTTDGVSRNVSGIIRQEVSNNLGPNLFMRGGQISTLRNGVDVTPLYRGPSPEDAAIIDRVEFVKGPSLFMNNIGDPAGTFNVATKQPTGSRQYNLQAMLGSYNLYRLAADLDGQVDKPGKLLYRLNVMGMSTESFVKHDFNRRFLIAPVLKYRLSERTALTAEYMYQRFSYAMQSPIVMTPNGFASLPTDFTLTEKNLRPYQVNDQSAFLTLTHQFSPNWRVTARGAVLRHHSDGIYLWVTGVNAAAPNVLLRNPKYDLTRSLVFSQQAFVNGSFATGPVRHQLLVGIDMNQKTLLANNYIEYDTYKDAAGATKLTYYPLDINNPTYGTEITEYSAPDGLDTRNTDQSIRYVSGYALDELGFFDSKLRLTLGGRYTSVRVHNEVSGLTTTSYDQAVTPRLGLSYSILPSLSVYGLYDQTLVPQAGVTSTGESIDPLRGTNRELGLKKNWLGGRWTSTASVYYITRSNIIATDPTNSRFRLVAGENHAQGVEVDVVGQVLKGLNVVVNYAYNDAKVDKDLNPKLVGARTPMYVKHVQNTWLNYELPARVLRGLTLSAGYQWQAGRGERYVTATPQAIPNFFRLDAGVGWHSEHIRINLLVNNVLNEKLVATPWFRNGLYYWVPQPGINGRLSLGYTF